MVSSQDAGPHDFVNLPSVNAAPSSQPSENWRPMSPMRGWLASMANVREAAEFTVEIIGVERQSSDSVTDCQVFSAASSMDSMRAACGRRSQVPVCGSLKPGSSPLPLCSRERTTVSG